MFKDKNSSSSEKGFSNAATLISSGTVLKGDVKSNHDLRIDGTIQGNVTSTAKIVIGPTGFVEGNIESANADITGKVQGNIVVKEFLQLRGECNVSGNLSAVKLQIDPTATFNGQCQMGNAASANTAKASILKMSSTDVQPAAQAK